MFLLRIEPRTSSPHAISLFKLTTDSMYKEINPSHVLSVWQQTVFLLEMENNGNIKEYKKQLIEEEKEYERLYNHMKGNDGV